MNNIDDVIYERVEKAFRIKNLSWLANDPY